MQVVEGQRRGRERKQRRRSQGKVGSGKGATWEPLSRNDESYDLHDERACMGREEEPEARVSIRCRTTSTMLEGLSFPV